MATKSKKPESRQGNVSDGWVKQGLQLPEHIRCLLSEEADRRGHGSIRTIGTAAICLFLGLPPEQRDRLFILAMQHNWRDADPIDPEQVVGQVFGEVGR